MVGCDRVATQNSYVCIKIGKLFEVTRRSVTRALYKKPGQDGTEPGRPVPHTNIRDEAFIMTTDLVAQRFSTEASNADVLGSIRTVYKCSLKFLTDDNLKFF